MTRPAASGAAPPTVRWGVLSTAMIATTRTIPAMAQAPSATLLAIASRRRDQAELAARELGAPRAYGSYDELLGDPEVDAVYVPLPNDLHVEWAVRAMEAGKHVLCEKPLCLRASDVAVLRGVRDRTGRHIEEAFGFRNHPQWYEIAALLRAGTIGAVRSLQATLAKQFLDPDDIRNDPARGGGALYDLGSYVLAACNAVFGRGARRVTASMDHDPDFRIDRLTTAMLDYGDAHATFTVATQSGPDSWATHQQLTVLGSTGWLRCDFPFAHARPTACRLEIGDAGSVGCLPTRTIGYEPVDQYALQIERFSRRLLGEAVPAWPIEDAAVTLTTIEALFRSARAGRWEDIPD
ncbi:Gfo/Idh/MocA family protein [Geodermatophilus sp. CPCC 205506]|uniref:Gfo/Idh/MocA family protein n=1 Tax=Geodermatophilus sp. CPCC 205506 TaxID=2936596 RepID=UPI003EEAACF5